MTLNVVNSIDCETKLTVATPFTANVEINPDKAIKFVEAMPVAANVEGSIT